MTFPPRGCGNKRPWPKMKPCVARDGQTAASDGNCNGCGKEAANLLADYVQGIERQEKDPNRMPQTQWENRGI